MRDISWIFDRIGLITAGLLALIVGSLVGRYLRVSSAIVLGTVAAFIGFLVTVATLAGLRAWQRSRYTGFMPRVNVNVDSRWLWSLGKGLIVAAAILYFGLVAFHSVTIGNLGAGFRMTSTDVRVAARCPNRPKTVLAFLARSELEAMGVALSQYLGEDTATIVCQHGWPVR